MDLRAIEIFCAVYEAGSISRAALRLEMAQPSVSSAVRKLENELGGQLFSRFSTGVRPTSTADGLYDRFQRVLKELEAARQSAFTATDVPAGPLRIALPPLFTQNVLPMMLPGFLERYPHVDLSIREAQPQRLIELLLNGDVDCIVSTAPPVDTRIASRQIASEPYVLIASRTGAVLPEGPIDLMKLAPIKLAVSVQSFRQAAGKYVDLNALPIRQIVDIEPSHTIKALVRHTDWQALLPATALITEGAEYQVRGISNPPMVAEYFVCRPARAQLPLSASAFVAEIEKVLKESGRPTGEGYT